VRLILGNRINTENGSVFVLDLKNNLFSHWLEGFRGIGMPALGHRELEVLDHLWEAERLSALELLERMVAAEVSLNTIQSTLERLHRKGLVEREKAGRAYRYVATLSRADIVRKVLNDLARDVGGGDLAPIVSGFAGFVAGDDPNVERELMALIEASRLRRD